MVKPLNSDSVDIASAAKWLNNPLISADERAWLESLLVADKNGDGFLTYEEISPALTGERWPSVAQLQKLFSQAEAKQLFRIAKHEDRPAEAICANSSTLDSALLFCTPSHLYMLGQNIQYLPITERITVIRQIFDYYKAAVTQNRFDHPYSVELMISAITAVQYLPIANHLEFLEEGTKFTASWDGRITEVAAAQTFCLKLEDRRAFVQQGLDSENAATRSTAVRQLKYLKPEDRLAIAQRGMNDSNGFVRACVLEQVHYLKKKDQAAILQQGIEDQHERTREVASYTAQNLGIQTQPSIAATCRMMEETWSSMMYFLHYQIGGPTL
ncbi:MAG: hypothetical protein COV45_01620 [Deltaproteobacteria bacterium CG11_big_fil_rev_8_21_14_0_20_47_16]|nr:MAG: hypothetical protein COV45_01620 [Deltaproteobacteria bacterium CG11_big_fil_rev_8_21_14_0_20_47_16]